MLKPKRINSTVIHNVNGASQSNTETIRFYLHKECYNPGSYKQFDIFRWPILTIQQFPGFREGFMISKKANTLGDVVKHGIVQSIWSLDSGMYLYNEAVEVPEDEHISTFYISISNPDYGNQYYSSLVWFQNFIN
jgi:hypothetical protein